MGLSSGPNNANLGLVFAYDTGDTVNSYIGEPTVNIAAGLGLVPVALDPVTYVGIEDGWLKYSLGGTWSSGTYPYAFALTPVTFTGGLPYCVRATVKTNVLSKFNYFGSSGISYVNEPKDYEGTLSSTLNPDGSYTVTRYNFAYTNTTAQAGYLFTNPVNGATFNSATDFVWIKDYQAEQKNHPTQYVNGTRSTTSGLLNLTGNSTVYLDNASFNSSAQIALDGSNDYIKAAQTSSFYTNQFTWEMVVKFTSNTGTYQGLVWAEGSTGGGSGYQYLLTLYNHTNLHYRIYNSITGWTSTDTANITFDPAAYNHIVWQFNNGTTNIFVNGTLFHTDTTRGYYSGGTDSAMFLGARNDGSYSSAMMPALYRCYSRTLAATEIQENYQNYKTRFNLT